MQLVPTVFLARVAVVAATLATVAVTGAAAQEKVGGWTVSRAPDAAGTCTAVRSYQDPADNGAANRITFALKRPPGGPTTFVLALFYEGWEWEAGEAVSAELLAGTQSLSKDARWTATAATELTGTFASPDLYLWGLSTAATLSLRFDEDAEAEFDIPDAGLAVTALRTCSRP